MVIRRTQTMKAKEAGIGISMKSTNRSFAAMNRSMIPNPYFRYLSELSPPLIAKYSDLSPSMAKMFDVYMTNRSLDNARTAGMESSANTTSDSSMTMTHMSRGVASLLPSTVVKN